MSQISKQDNGHVLPSSSSSEMGEEWYLLADDEIQRVEVQII